MFSMFLESISVHKQLTKQTNLELIETPLAIYFDKKNKEISKWLLKLEFIWCLVDSSGFEVMTVVCAE